MHFQPTPRPRPVTATLRVRLAPGIVLSAVAMVARADCIDDAAARHQVDALVLRAIGWQESRLQPAALGRNANGSIDVGAFQINSVHLAELRRYGIERSALADGCVSAEVAAWHYRRQVDLYGDGWRAVGAYHSHTPALAARYANQIAAILMRWQVIARGELPFATARMPVPARAPQVPQPVPSAPSPVNAVPVDGVEATATFREIAYLPTAR